MDLKIIISLFCWVAFTHAAAITRETNAVELPPFLLEIIPVVKTNSERGTSGTSAQDQIIEDNDGVPPPAEEYQAPLSETVGPQPPFRAARQPPFRAARQPPFRAARQPPLAHFPTLVPLYSLSEQKLPLMVQPIPSPVPLSQIPLSLLAGSDHLKPPFRQIPLSVTGEDLVEGDYDVENDYEDENIWADKIVDAEDGNENKKDNEYNELYNEDVNQEKFYEDEKDEDTWGDLMVDEDDEYDEVDEDEYDEEDEDEQDANVDNNEEDDYEEDFDKEEYDNEDENDNDENADEDEDEYEDEEDMENDEVNYEEEDEEDTTRGVDPMPVFV